MERGEGTIEGAVNQNERAYALPRFTLTPHSHSNFLEIPPLPISPPLHQFFGPEP